MFTGRTLTPANADLDTAWNRVSSIDVRGDADLSLVVATMASVQAFRSVLTANRRVFPPAGRWPFSRFRVTRTGGGNGFALLVHAGIDATTPILAALAPDEWCEIANDGVGYTLIGAGVLT